MHCDLIDPFSISLFVGVFILVIILYRIIVFAL